MKKVKISELPLFNSLKGLFTIGTDSDNRSVKVSLEFIETETTAAVGRSDAAANKATSAAEKANTSALTAQQSAKNADMATANAKQAKIDADTASKTALAAAEKADTSTANADKATKETKSATEQTLTAKQATETATKEANTAKQKTEEATAKAQTATEAINALRESLVPTGLTVSCVKRLTIGNSQPVIISAALTPDTAPKNIIFISDNNAVGVGAADGRLSVIREGKSTVYIVPTLNTSLAKAVTIEVGKPLARLYNLKALRLTSGGGFRLT